jgi:hypothetical protein
MVRLGTLVLALCAVLVAPVSAAPITQDWLRVIRSQDHAEVADVVLRPDGTVAVTGQFEGPTIFGKGTAGGVDAFVAVFRPGGKLLWSAVLGGSGADWGTGVASGDEGQVIVAGATESAMFDGKPVESQRDAFVAVFTPDGSLAWSELLGGDGIDGAAGVAFGARAGANVLAVTGTTGSDTFEGIATPPLTDAFVAWFGTAQVPMGVRVLGGSATEIGWGVTMGADGSTYVAGHTASGDFPAGQPAPGLSGNGFLAKYHPTGARGWTRIVGAGKETLGDVVFAKGAVYVAGTSLSATLEGEQNHGAGDILVARYRPNGTRTWLRLLGSARSESGATLSTRGDGLLWVAGTRSVSDKGATLGSSDSAALVVRVRAADGAPQRQFVLDGDGTDQMSGVAAAAGGAFVAGDTTSISIGGKNTGPAETDGFVARLK